MSRYVAFLLIFYPMLAFADAASGANPDYVMSFPLDHGAHPKMKIEWWYYTGNVSSGSQEFGYQLTFFRVRQASEISDSPWSFKQLYFAHFAISDLTKEEFYFRERLGRGSLGRAGATEGDLSAWVGPWHARRENEIHTLFAETEKFSLSVQAKESDMLLHGENGYSQKSSTPGNASHYYSFPRMKTEGVIRIGETSWNVSGTSWMDHEFGSSFLEKGQTGWDWFSLRLSDGSNLMLFRIRNKNGNPFYKGTIESGGVVKHLEADDFSISELKFFTSEKSGARYPTAWRVQIPDHSINFEVRARFNAQEPQGQSWLGAANTTYWEGSVLAEGSHSGEGYLEMTGYSGCGMDSLLSKNGGSKQCRH